jgi:hypothetical protein
MKRPAIIFIFDGEKQHTTGSIFTDELIERPAGRDILRIVTYQDLRDIVVYGDHIDFYGRAVMK